MLRVLDLFSGIGGFSLGLERTGGFRTVRFVERDPFCQAVLRRHWPNVLIDGDIAECEFSEGEADVVTGGFPCQDLSTAGKQAGIDGERSGLWGELARTVGVVRPSFAIIENVSALLSGDDGRWFARVLRDLAALGYDAEWHSISAAHVGAPHIRDRVWILAYPADAVRRPVRNSLVGGEVARGREAALRSVQEGLRNPIDGGPAASGWWAAEPGVGRVAHGVPARVDRHRAIGNAVVPQIPEMIGRAILTSLNEQQEAA